MSAQPYNRYMKDHEHLHAAKSFIAFMVVAIAAAMFFVFYNNQENILEGGNFQLFMTLAVVGAGLLIGLFYLVSNTSHTPVKSHKSTKSTSKSKKKKSK